ncbi:TPA: hypothetical protein NJ055_004637 [Vibrio parahaemolyticus]|nr:hypothetical protein [Vibrio parahaemolyticus]HCG5940486.1 hypothetical protein [Vibrio parahaemolyticus]
MKTRHYINIHNGKLIGFKPEDVENWRMLTPDEFESIRVAPESFVEKQAGKFSFEFDTEFFTIRRNLMFASTVSLLLFFVKPSSSGVYDVNIGILKGSIDNPIYLYAFAITALLYYVALLVSHCRNLTVSRYSQIKAEYFSALSESKARVTYMKAYLATNGVLPTPDKLTFSQKHQHAISVIIPKFNIAKHRMEMLGFEVLINHDVCELVYHSRRNLSQLELEVLRSSLDLYWRAGISKFVTVVVPILYAALVLILQVQNVVGMVGD